MPGSYHPEITLAMPAYNEEANIHRVVTESITALEQINRSWEVLVIDNCSNDLTPVIVREMAAADSRVRLIVHEENRLYSGSCRTAIEQAAGKYICIMDSDGQFTAADIPHFIARIDQGANLVFGWRKQRHDPLFRKAMSLVFNTMGRVYLGVKLRDLNVGIRVFDRRFAEVAAIRHRMNMANPELYVRAMQAGLRVQDVEIQHFERLAGAVCHDFRKLGKLFLGVNAYFRQLRQELRQPSLSVLPMADKTSHRNAA